MVKLFSALTVILILPVLASGYIVPTRTVLEKVSDNAGRGIYAIEQEITFQHSDSPIVIKETWIIESDRSMKLSINAQIEPGKNIQIQNVYINNKKTALVDGAAQSNTISNEFVERYFNSRNSDALANLLTQMKIIPGSAMQKKQISKKVEEITHTPEDWVRLSRSQGVVNYAFGTPTPTGQVDNLPGLWVEQDQFVVRKLRFPSQAEVTASDYSSYNKNLWYPKSRTIRWNNHSAEIKVLSANSRPASVASEIKPESIKLATNLEALDNHPAKEMIVEFYKRFR